MKNHINYISVGSAKTKSVINLSLGWLLPMNEWTLLFQTSWISIKNEDTFKNVLLGASGSVKDYIINHTMKKIWHWLCLIFIEDIVTLFLYIIGLIKSRSLQMRFFIKMKFRNRFFFHNFLKIPVLFRKTKRITCAPFADKF